MNENSTYSNENNKEYKNNKSNNYILSEQNIENKSTFEKIIFLQGLLKQLTSAKDRFEGIKDKMISKINNNCFNYYKSKIGIKQIYDYCESNNPDIYNEYIFLPDAKSILLNKYESIYKTFFIFRNDNSKLLKIIKSSPVEYHKELSNFLVHFFYENTINNSFNNDELILLIYLVLENLILKKLSEKNNYSTNKKLFLNNNFEYHLIKQLTRRTDIRNYLCSILSDLLLKIENYRDHLFIEIEKIDDAKEKKNKNENDNESNILFDDPDFNFGEAKTLKKSNNKNIKKSKKNKLKDTLDQFLFIKDVAPINIIRSSNIYKSRKSIRLNQPKIKLFDINNFDEGNDFEFLQKFDEPNGGRSKKEKMIDPFFEENNIDIIYLNDKLEEYKNLDNNEISIMKKYLDNQINEINSKKENKDIFSNNLINKAFEQIKKDYNMDNYNYLINTIKKNYLKITSFIKELLDILNENINSLPYTIKCISNIIEILIEKKYSKLNISNYDKIMFKISFFMGNIILPILSNPEYNGIITNEVTSKITKENLKVISKIFKQIISGHLFSNKTEPEYTIFNKFIFGIMPEIFKIVNNIQQNFNLPDFIINYFNTSDQIDDENRNINYDYFKENNNNETIQFQSISFSYKILYIFIHIILIEKEYFITNNKNEEEKKIFNEIINYKELIKKWYNNGVKNKKKEFFFLSNINYQKELKEKMNLIIAKNYHELMLPNNEKKNDNLILYEFKNCLLGVLAYVNILHKENFENLILRKEQKIHNKNIIELLYQNKLNEIYKNVKFDSVLENEISNNGKNKDNDNINYKDDLDFKSIIFPYIMNSAKYEIGFNLDIEKNKKITIFMSYIQLHLNNIPRIYYKNNYSFLFTELIKESIELINLLNNTSILNHFHLKILEGNKLNSIINNHYLQIKNMEKSISIQYLFHKTSFLSKFNTTQRKGLITKIEYKIVKENDSLMPNVDTILSLLDVLPDFRKYENKVEDIIDLEEKVEFADSLNKYFYDLKNQIKNEEIIKRFTIDEVDSISVELENHILFKLYDKIYPSTSTKNDIEFYKKCCCLDFVKPENLIKDKKIINEKLWKTSMNYINEADEKYTPIDKLKCYGKAFSILQNSINFCSGKEELGVDDTVPPLIYIFIKSKPKNLISNYNFCTLFLNPLLSKKEFGIILSQIGLVMNVIKDMTHKDLINISEEEFKNNYNNILYKIENNK